MEPQEPPVEPAEPEKRNENRIKGIGTIVAAALVALSKFKFLLFGLKFLGASWTFILSLVLYVTVFGWRFGVVILLAIAAHEFGHFFAYRAYGLSVRIPVFIPFMGAFTAGAIAPDLEQDAYIALAGPLTGLVLAAACFVFGAATGDRFWIACASLSALLNLFNMIPVLPFDGGRVIGAIWWPLWALGMIILIVAAAYIHVPIVFMIIIAALGVPAMIAAFRGKVDPRLATMTNAARLRVGVWYLITALGLILILGKAQAILPPNTSL